MEETLVHGVAEGWNCTLWAEKEQFRSLTPRTATQSHIATLFQFYCIHIMFYVLLFISHSFLFKCLGADSGTKTGESNAVKSGNFFLRCYSMHVNPTRGGCPHSGIANVGDSVTTTSQSWAALFYNILNHRGIYLCVSVLSF